MRIKRREELADIAIYLFGIAEINGICLEQAILKKMAINEKRVYKKVDGVLRKDDEKGSAADSIVFVTHNPGKVASASEYFDGKVKFEIYSYEIKEIRGTLDEIAVDKVKSAYEITKRPTIAMDAGFELKGFNGFPGVYVNSTLETIGVDGILKLMECNKNRECSFTQSLAYYDGMNDPILFHGEHKGILATEKRGMISDDDWSDLSLIFIPVEEVCNEKRTLAQLSHDERVQLSQQAENHSAFAEFRKWYLK